MSTKTLYVFEVKEGEEDKRKILGIFLGGERGGKTRQQPMGDDKLLTLAVEDQLVEEGFTHTYYN